MAGRTSDLVDPLLSNPRSVADARKPDAGEGIARKRPNGRFIQQYAKHETWSKRRWAWEFLKRNEEFRAACDGLDSCADDDVRRVAICERFGLLRFRHYNERYVRPFPNFALGNVRAWIRLEGLDHLAGEARIPLKPGQVAILFDLNHALTNVRSLRAQLAHARRRLERYLKRLAVVSGKTPLEPKPKSDHFLDCLRMLDAKADGMPRADIARMLFPDEAKGYDNEQARELFKNRFRPAQDLIRGGYLDVASAYYDAL